MSKAMSASREHTVSGFFVFCLIGLFAVLLTTLTLFGVKAYRSVYDASAINSEGQIALSYLQNKVHSADSDGEIALANFDNTRALVLSEPIDGEAYETRIYFYSGSLCECFCPSSEAFDPTFGEPIAELQSFDIEAVKPWLLRVTLTQLGGVEQSSHIALRAGEVAAR